ncbi:YHS domain-containing protein [Candidatus Peregrinibacteria bacterium]|nr:MAG: YHS domain-containing protein [Candidatus Peregrinibacteria bacterium]
MENSSCCSPKNSSPVKDVVCGMELTPTEDTLQVAHKGSIYYFCNAACKDQFAADPGKYLS